jgi:hypothetical protein
MDSYCKHKGYILDRMQAREKTMSGKYRQTCTACHEHKLSSVIRSNNWNWLPARSDALVKIQSSLHMVHLGDRDIPLSVTSNSNSYSSRGTWEELRDKLPIVEWWSLVWFSLAIPKHSFILWLAIKIALLLEIYYRNGEQKGRLNVCFV